MGSAPATAVSDNVLFFPSLDQARIALIDKVLEQHLEYEQSPILERVDVPIPREDDSGNPR